MLGLTDYQLKIVMAAARLVPVEKRDTFLQRIAAMLALRGRGRFTDTDVADVAQLALCGLIQSADTVLDLPIVFPAGLAGKILCKKCLILLGRASRSRALYAVPPKADVERV